MPNEQRSGQAIYLIAYLCAVLGVLLIGCGSMVALEIGRPDGINTAVSYQIITLCGTIMAVLLGVIKSIGNGDVAQQTALKVDHLHDCYHTIQNASELAAAQSKLAVDVAVETKKEIIAAVVNGKKIDADVTVHVKPPLPKQ